MCFTQRKRNDHFTGRNLLKSTYTYIYMEKNIHVTCIQGLLGDHVKGDHSFF